MTLPGGVRPVEQMVDAAIERIAREQRSSLARLDDYDGSGSYPAATYPAGNVGHALALAPEETPVPSKPTRLNWKGLDVSEEFRSYAERIARGEDLPPFEGRVLAEPNAAFPWGPLAQPPHPQDEAAPLPAHPGRGGQLALWLSAAVVMSLLAWSVALKLEAIEPPNALLNAAVPSNGEAASAAAQVRASLEPSLAAPVTAAPDTLAHEGAAQPALEPLAPSASASLPGSSVPSVSAPASVPPLAAPLPLAVSVAPASPEPGAALSPAAQPLAAPTSAALTSAAPTSTPAIAAAPSPAPAKAAASAPADPDLDFGIDELPLASSANAKSVNQAGNLADPARAGQPGGVTVRKEPGSESSAKESLLVDNPSF